MMEIYVPFTWEELVLFNQVYNYLLTTTEKENIFEWLTVIPGVKNWDMIL